jgi:hypothetical protein
MEPVHAPKRDGGNEDVANQSFISDLICEDFVNFKPQREIYNMTFTFPRDAKTDLCSYVKNNGKHHLVNMILEEVRKCQTVDLR